MQFLKIMISILSLLLTSCFQDSDNVVDISNIPENEIIITQPSIDLGLSTVNSAESLRAESPVVNRDTTQSPPTINEASKLNYLDSLLNYTLNNSSRYTYESIAYSILRRASIKLDIPLYIDNDFRDSRFPFGGGVTGHSKIIIDGKFIDILYEISAYMAAYDNFIIYENIIEATNAVVQAQNYDRGFQAYYIYDRQYLSETANNTADKYFEELFSAIIFHEFGHYYLYHMLDTIRVENTAYSVMLSYSTQREDACDYIAGVLMKKAGYSTSARGGVMMDIMAYYILKRSNYLLSFSDIILGQEIQYTQLSSLYSSLSVRKENLRRGFEGEGLIK